MCDTGVVVLDDRVLFAKNSDRDPNEAQRLEWVPHATYPSGSEVRCTWRSIPQAQETYAMLLSRPYWMWGAEMGTNSHGVTIGNEAVFTNQPHQEDGLLGMDLLRLALERSKTAQEAVQTIATLVESYGQGGRCGYDHARFQYHNAFLIADRTQAWVLETADRSHATERVQGARAISNGLTIASFAKAHRDPLRSWFVQCDHRRSLMESGLKQARTPQDVASVLRTHEKGPQPTYRVHHGAMGGVCMHSGGLIGNSHTVNAWISELSTDHEGHYSTATSTPCLSGFKPISLSSPLSLGQPTGVYDDQSAWWQFEALHRSLSGKVELTREFLNLRNSWEEHIWRNEHTSQEAFASWGQLLEDFQIRVGRSHEPSILPAYVQRYWQKQEASAQQQVPRLPPR